MSQKTKTIKKTNEEWYFTAIQISWMLSEKIPHFVKFRLREISEKLNRDLKTYLEFRDKEIEKYADEDGNINEYVQKGDKLVKNPKAKLYRDAMKEINEDERELNVRRVALSSIAKLVGENRPYTHIYDFFYDDLQDEEESPAAKNGQLKEEAKEEVENIN